MYMSCAHKCNIARVLSAVLRRTCRSSAGFGCFSVWLASWRCLAKTQPSRYRRLWRASLHACEGKPPQLLRLNNTVFTDVERGGGYANLRACGGQVSPLVEGKSPHLWKARLRTCGRQVSSSVQDASPYSRQSLVPLFMLLQPFAPALPS